MLCLEILYVDWTAIGPARDAVGYCITHIDKTNSVYALGTAPPHVGVRIFLSEIQHFERCCCCCVQSAAARCIYRS